MPPAALVDIRPETSSSPSPTPASPSAPASASSASSHFESTLSPMQVPASSTRFRQSRSASSSQSAGSPTASTTLQRTAETLEGLAMQLQEMEYARVADSESELRCCCGAAVDCPVMAAYDRRNSELKFCGEIGSALLQRYEALEKKYNRSEQQLEIKRKALADSLRHAANLERSNTALLSKSTDLQGNYDSLEKRYTQSLHTQTLTQQSLTHVRSELSKARALVSAQDDAELEKRLVDAERRFEEARDLHQAESRRLREQMKWRDRAESRINELENKLTSAGREVEEARAARAKDAQDLLANAKERLDALHSDLSESFGWANPSERPEYQRTLEDLVATNTLLKHHTSEMARSLGAVMEENRGLKEELAEVRNRRPSPPATRPRPLSTELRPLLARGGHARTGSNPITGSTVPASRVMAHTRVVSAAMPRTMPWEHRRQSSLAPSITSVSTTTDGNSITSPHSALGLGQVDDYGSPMSRADSYTLTSPDSRISPRIVQRGSFSSGGIPYHYNGVPKAKPGSRPNTQRKRSDRRSLTMRALGVGEAITEWVANSSTDEEPPSYSQGTSPSASEDHPLSPRADSASASGSASDGSRKRVSVLLPGGLPSLSPRTTFDELAALDLPSPVTETSGQDRPGGKRVARRTLLLLSRTAGVQTDPLPEFAGPVRKPYPKPSKMVDAATDPEGCPPAPSADETPTEAVPAPKPAQAAAARHVAKASGPQMTLRELIEFLAKILSRMRGVDVPTLNKRLKKQNLPGADVGHMSRSAIGHLQAEVANMRHQFRSLLEVSNVDRKDVAHLLALLKDVFSDVLDLQSVVNDVTINPKLAKRLQREAFADEDAEAAAAAKAGGGLSSWIAAPISNLFATQVGAKPEDKAAGAAPSSPVRGERPNRLMAPVPVRAAPKLLASTSATNTHVSVEFGTTGQVRRAAPATPPRPKKPSDGDVFSSGGATPTVSYPKTKPAASPTKSGAMPPPASMRAGSARQGPPRASRSDLLSIFAGAHPVAASPLAPHPRMRHTSSQYFAGRPVRESVGSRGGGGGLSTIVDAVLDPTMDGTEPGDPTGEFKEPLLKRTLRPRGLSDSSIRTTATRGDGPLDDVPIAPPVPPTRMTAPQAGRSVSGGSASSAVTNTSIGSSMFSTLSRKLYGLRGVTPDTVDTPPHGVKEASLQEEGDEEVLADEEDEEDVDSSENTWHDMPPPLAIPRSPSPSPAMPISASPRPAMPALPETSRLAVTRSRAASTGVSPTAAGAEDLLGHLSVSHKTSNRSLARPARLVHTHRPDDEDEDTLSTSLRRGVAGSLGMHAAWR